MVRSLLDSIGLKSEGRNMTNDIADGHPACGCAALYFRAMRVANSAMVVANRLFDVAVRASYGPGWLSRPIDADNRQRSIGLLPTGTLCLESCLGQTRR